MTGSVITVVSTIPAHLGTQAALSGPITVTFSEPMSMSSKGAGFGEVSGTSLSELAWVVAACELGQECGPDSTLMTTYCANGGICSRDSSQDFSAFVLDAGVPRQGAGDRWRAAASRRSPAIRKCAR